MEFLAKPNMDSFLPHAEFGVVPEDVLEEFVKDRAGTFLAATKLIAKLESVDRARTAEEVVQRAPAARIRPKMLMVRSGGTLSGLVPWFGTLGHPLG